MLSIYDNLGGCSRREFLRVGALGLGGLTLSQLLALRAAAAEAGIDTTGKSVIFLFQHGGPSQYETFDPHMDAGPGIRSATGETATSVPGVTFGGTFTRLARHMHRLAIVRSYQSGDANHKLQPLVCPETLDGNMGSFYSHLTGATDPTSGLPRNVMLFPNSVDANEPGESRTFGQFTSPGELGAGSAPFVPGAGSAMLDNMRLKLSRERLDDRRSLLARLDRIKRGLDLSGTMEAADEFQQQAFDTLLGSVADAFDLSKEDPRTLARYDTRGLLRPADWQAKNNREHYHAHANTLGRLCLMARRLCEAGCGFVTINTAFVWDMHSDRNNLAVAKGMELVGAPFDHAVSALIEDIEARGLSDKILLVATGEMGRTPRIDARGGRSHWGRLTPLMFYGGGVTAGQVIGRSTHDGGEPDTRPVRNADLLATVMANLVNLEAVRNDERWSIEVRRALSAGQPVAGLS
ncbi:MAG: DUF1501 domain-containing protein [Planctomycetota bacterium]|nr:MAG: DUF1501 domain-containing protein [Planctomycetota bacterium]REJ93316.1 MAG: DUF1501 domain-containing protein [Planctomycetota bacterium]